MAACAVRAVVLAYDTTNMSMERTMPRAKPGMMPLGCLVFVFGEGGVLG